MIRIRLITLLFSLLTLSYTSLLAQSSPNFLLDPETLSLLEGELSGEQAKEHVIAITRHHRISGSQGYTEAASYVLEQLQEFGFSPQEAWIESFTADGKIQYQTWTSPSGWNISSAELRMIKPKNKLIIRYPEIAMSVITRSNSGEVRAELVDVGTGTSDEDYLEKDVSGKLVLATGDADSVHRLAVLKYGAAAIICYLDDVRTIEHPNMLQYAEIQPKSDELDHLTFGFNITSQQGHMLKKLLSSGKQVVLNAKVEGPGLEPGSLDVVVAIIPGGENPEQELLYTAHLDHPKESANDNASGSAAILDIARTFKNLINQGQLPRPRRTLRFLWVPELYGTMAYVDAHPELQGPTLGGNFLANLNLDMVGENLELLHSQMSITWPPVSISSALSDVVPVMAEYVDRLDTQSFHHSSSNFNYRIVPFSNDGDHMIFNDGMIRIPSMMMRHWPDYTRHTSEDTPDKVDPVELERSEIIAASTFWYLSNLSETQSLELVNLVASKAHGRLASEVRKAADHLLKVPPDQLEEIYNEGRGIISFALRKEIQALRSILHYVSATSTQSLIRTWTRTLESQAQLKIQALQALMQQRGGRLSFSPSLTAEELEADSWIPTRVTRGPLANGLPESRLTPEEKEWYKTPEVQELNTYLLVNFIDGQRSILEIRNTLSAAYQPVSLEIVDHFIRDLAKLRLVELKKSM